MTTIPDTPSPHEDNAQAIRLELQRLVNGIRGFTLLTTEQRRKYNVSGHVDDDFLRGVALLLEAHPDVASVTQLSAAEIRDHLNFYGSYQSVGDELTLHGRKTTDTVRAERGNIGERALRTLKIARNLNSPAGRESLVPHLEALDREFTRGRRRRTPGKKPDELAAKTKKGEVKP